VYSSTKSSAYETEKVRCAFCEAAGVVWRVAPKWLGLMLGLTQPVRAGGSRESRRRREGPELGAGVRR
jgi:hypothetical protein